MHNCTSIIRGEHIVQKMHDKTNLSLQKS